MFVVTLGPGNVDLSIPACMTLAGTVAMKVMDEANALILVGLGIARADRSRRRRDQLRADPLPAHPADHRDALSSSFVFQSAAIWYNRGLRIKPPPALAEFTTGMVGGMPVLAIVVADRVGAAACGAGPNGLRPARDRDRPEPAGGEARRRAGRAHPGADLHAVRTARGALRLPRGRFLRRRGAEHGGGVPAVFDRRGRDRRHLGRWRLRQRPRPLGRVRCSCSCW